MVPGALITVTPWRAASPDRGRTWPSKPSGTAIAKPHGMRARAPGANVIGSATAAARSIAAARWLLYSGRGSPSDPGSLCIARVIPVLIRAIVLALLGPVFALA